MSKARNIADIGSDDVISTSSTGIDVTGTVTADEMAIQGVLGASGSSSNNAADEFFIDNNGDTGMTLGSSITGTGYYAFADTDVALRAGLFYDHSTDDMGFRVAAATRMTIDSSGNVGIGTSSPSAPLTIQTTGSTNGLVVTSPASSLLSFIADDDATAGGPYTSTITGASNGAMYFSTGGSEAMRIDSSGNVGIGTSSPSNALEVSGEGVLRIRPSTDNSQGELYFNDTTTSGNSYRSDIGIVDNGGLFFKTTGTINTAPTEAMRIDSSGNVQMGTTSGATGVTTVIQRGTVAALQTRTGTASSVAHINFENLNGVVGAISTSAGTTTYATSSDYRLKENITPIQGAADIVKSMRPCTYTFKVDSTDWHDGFLAHELQELHPRAVTGSKDAMKDEEYEVTPAVLDEDGAVVTEAVMGTRSVPDYQGVDYSKLTPILTAALQEALTKIDTLEAQNATFEARLAALEAV